MTSIRALLAIGAGIALLLWSVWSNVEDLRRPLSDSTKALGLVRWLRTTILGLAAVAIPIGSLWDVWPLIGLALIIAGEETLETTSVIRAMERYPGMAPESVLPPHRRLMSSLQVRNAAANHGSTQGLKPVVQKKPSEMV
jgi:hypothetical protein